MATNHSAAALFASDEQLKGHKELHAKYSKLASDEEVARAVAALQQKHGAKVVVVNTKEEALAAALAAVPKGASISAAGSTTLTEIGYDEWAKHQKDHRDFKAESLAKYGTPESGELRRQGLAADVFFTSVTAISQEGELAAVDLTGTRVGGFLAAKELVVVAGTQKIVKDHAAIVQRTTEYCLAVESARARDAYKVPGSQIVNSVYMNGKSPFSPAPRLTVVLIKHAFGY